jgi:hypothetical protein
MEALDELVACKLSPCVTCSNTSGERVFSCADSTGVHIEMCCPSGGIWCGYGCQDITSDVKNCGYCRNVCPIGSTCQGGKCVCPDGENDCGGYCQDIVNDNNNCGQCGNVCNIAQGFKCYRGRRIPNAYYVPGEVPWVKQPENANLCWAADATILYSYTNEQSYTIDDVMKIAGPYFNLLYNSQDPSLSKEDLGGLADSLGFAHEREETIDYSSKDWVYLLIKHGPLWVTLDTGANPTHGVIVYGIEPRIGFPATHEYTTIFYNDPLLGPDSTSLEDFTKRFRGTGVENIRIVHAKKSNI